MLSEHGADALTASLPVGPRRRDGVPEKQTADDFIVRFGEQAFRDFVESKINHRPVVRNLEEYRQEMVSARLDSLLCPGWMACDQSPPGAGKSFADRAAAAAAGTSLTVVPTHRNCAEVAEDYRESGLDAEAYPQLTPKTCDNHDAAIQAIEHGLSASSAVCPTCGSKEACDYRDQMETADAAAHRVATHHRAQLQFSGLATGRRYISVHEDAASLIRPMIESHSGFDRVAEVSRDAKEHARFRQDMDAYHFFERMENVARLISEHLQQDEITAPLCLPPASTNPRGVDSHLLAAMMATRVWPPADAVRIAKGVANNELAELVLRVDSILTPGREPQAKRSVVAVWRTEIPGKAVVWWNDGTADADELQSILERSVTDRTPSGKLERQHAARQVILDITKGSAPSSVLKALRGVLAAFPDAQRIGVITHQNHLPSIRGTAHEPKHRLDEHLRKRIAKSEHFRSGDSRGSNSWIDECDLLLVLGTPRVPPTAVKSRLIRFGLALAAARDGRWAADYWPGVTTTGKRVTVKTSGYRDHDWHAAHRAIVRAELLQSIGRARGICENGIPAVVLTNENLGLPILEMDVQPLSETAVKAIQAIAELSAPFPKGESTRGQAESYPHCFLNSITLGKGADSSITSTSDIASAIGLQDRQALYVLNDLAERSLISRVGQRGEWSLAPKGRAFASIPPPSTMNQSSAVATVGDPADMGGGGF